MGILTEEMKRVVSEQRLGYVATVCPDGTPNLSPKGTLAVWDDDHLVFADIHSARTIANIQHNPMVETNVVDVFARKGYRFRGKAIALSEGALFDEIVAFYQERDVFDAPKRIRTVVLVKVDRALPLISPGYDRKVTEDEVREKWESYYLGLKQKS